MNVTLPSTGALPRLRDDVQISPFSGSGGAATPRFLVQAGSACFVVNAEMRELIASLAEHPATLPELADKVNARTGKTVSIETLRTILQTRLSPNLFQAQTEHRIKTPFTFSWLLIPPRLAQAITKRLTWLFRWPAFVIGIAAFAWIEYRIFHTTRDFHTAAQSSWFGFLLIYGGVALGSLVHEFGHLTACARKGAEHGGIGLGLYLLFPAFYADVSNAWRLPRSARVAVDLGGLYFQSLFLTFAGIFALRSHNTAFFQLNFFTLTIMVFTLNPALKFDGYWLLVDASGVHNLYPRMAAMMRGIFRRRKPDKAIPPVSEETKIFLGIYTTLVVVFSALLAVLVAVSTYQIGKEYPAKIMAVVHAFSHLAGAKAGGILESLFSLGTDSFWLLIIAVFAFDITRKTVREFAKA